MIVKRRITFSLNNINLSHIFLFFVFLNFFWAVWTELSFSEVIYEVCTFALFGWAALYFFLNLKSKVSDSSMACVLCVGIWCLLMFGAYQICRNHSTVSFLGFSMDSYAKIMIYDLVLLIPGMFLRDACVLKQKNIFKLALAVILISSLVLTMYAVAVYPNAMRSRVTAEMLGYEDILFGLPEYTNIYAMSLFFPWLLMKTKNEEGLNKLFYMVLAICLVLLVALSQFATALIAMIVGFVVYFIGISKDRPIRAMACILLFVLFFVVGMDTWGELLINISQNTEGDWADKLVEIGEFLQGNEASGDLGSRLDYYSTSWSSFVKSPLLGTITAGKMNFGGHATLFDILASVGIVGTIPFLIFIVLTIRKMLACATNTVSKASVWGTVAIFLVLLFLKNIISAISILYSFAVLLPILYNSEAQNELDKKTNIQ